MSPATYKSITTGPFAKVSATPVQAAVFGLLPDLVTPTLEDSTRKKGDLVVLSDKTSDRFLSFLVPVVEVRQKEIALHTGREFASRGNPHADIYEHISDSYSRSTIGALILTATNEDALAIESEAASLLRSQEMGTILSSGGPSKRMRPTEQKDILVATPSCLRTWFREDPALKEALKTTQLLIIDQADQMLECGFRDDIDAIVELLPNRHKRQTFVFAQKRTYAIKQMCDRLLNEDHHIINLSTCSNSIQCADVQQYRTVLPDATHYFSYVLKLLAHDQMVHNKRSKVIVYVPTWQIAQLFAVILQNLSSECLSGGEHTNIYEVHSKTSRLDRAESLNQFVQEDTMASVLLTTNLATQEVQSPGITRLIHLGVPPIEPAYFGRLNHLLNSKVDAARNDFVILPWEMGYFSWQLSDVPFLPLNVGELESQLLELSSKSSSKEQGERRSLHHPQETIRPVITDPDVAGKTIPYQLDADHIRQAFVSILGYYVPRSREIREQRASIVQGIKDWVIGACGVRQAPYVSKSFLSHFE
ncbi:hypothetical protein M408DRAFT_80767 [Serendipita vermifera MAFF 305830]|uniref:ATP-dependent RNA helicase n=1 Tax=Serendipita vermifera MAFF 305830 TaxID=933852 RepID=A0A0C3A9F9_SERVB|nr:hypothetical protein M408DRAFT_80767 [Serendipita vermifera MAFF 305830]